jgi:GGDEF domain-containing protein
VQNTLNIAFNVSVNYIQQMNLRRTVERAAQSNPVTGLPNLKGAVQWFESFSANDANHYKTLSVTVYGLPKYTYILENHGMDAVEESLRITAEALKMANPSHCFIAHVAQDTFAVINYYVDGNDVGPTIDQAGAVFHRVDKNNNSFTKVSGCSFINCSANAAGGLELDSKTITVKDIDAVADPILSAEVFKLSDAVLQNDYDRAAAILGDLLKMQTEPIVILAALGNQLRRIHTARLAIDGGKDKYWLMELWDMRTDYPAKLLLTAAKRTSAEWCASAVKMCQMLDRRMKSEKGIDAAGELKLLLVQLGAGRK